MAKQRRLIQTQRLFKEAKRYLVAGVNSPVRSFNYVGGNPLLIRNGRGAYVYDYDGNGYIDYVLSWGSLILGHTYPAVINAVKQTADKGLSFGATNKAEIELAWAISQVIPLIEKIRFVNSGTEAVASCVRLARGYTERPKIVKFSGAYHGCADYLLTKAGSGLATQGIPLSKGVPAEYLEHTLTVPYGDFTAIAKLFKRYGPQIAAVLVEPVGANCGVVQPDISFLKYIRGITAKHKSLLIFDEVITGFRFHFGTAAQLLGVEPDLVTLGKIIGGGLPIGAYGGNNKIMNNLSPQGKVYQASTFSGNPVVMQAGLSTLDALSKLKDKYKRLENFSEHITGCLENEARARGLAIEVSRFGSLFSFKFSKKRHFKIFYRQALKRGVYFAPSEFEVNFLSFAHTEDDIEETAFKVRDSIKNI